jgi:hypothetical protein
MRGRVGRSSMMYDILSQVLSQPNGSTRATRLSSRPTRGSGVASREAFFGFRFYSKVLAVLRLSCFQFRASGRSRALASPSTSPSSMASGWHRGPGIVHREDEESERGARLADRVRRQTRERLVTLSLSVTRDTRDRERPPAAPPLSRSQLSSGVF